MTILQDADKKALVDVSRVYLFGHSAGGILATLYANRMGAPWRAVATHAGVLDAGHVVAADPAPRCAIIWA